jgi:hypothetical protein
MRSLSAHENINVDKMAGIYTGKRAYHFDGIDVLPLNDFLDVCMKVKFFDCLIKATKLAKVKTL